MKVVTYLINLDGQDQRLASATALSSIKLDGILADSLLMMGEVKLHLNLKTTMIFAAQKKY